MCRAAMGENRWSARLGCPKIGERKEVSKIHSLCKAKDGVWILVWIDEDWMKTGEQSKSFEGGDVEVMSH